MWSDMPATSCHHVPPQARSSADGDFFFYIEGLPAHYTWGNLKDLARKATPFPGWTEMASDPKTQRGHGWVKIRRQSHAESLYGFLTSGNPALERLTVYLWSTAKSPPRLLRCNRDVPRFVQEAQWPLHPAFNPYSSLGHPSSVVQYLPRTAPAPRMKPQTYVVTQNQRPVNATSGLVKTQSRGVFICRLGFDVNQQQLEVYLSRFGPLQNCEIKRDPTTGKSRGTATAKFLSAEIAATVVCSLDGQQFMGKRVEVRFDKDHEMVAAVNTVNDCLIIANGSQ